MNKFVKYIAIAAAALGMTSCNDFFELKPKNEMVLEDFWKSESDVLSVVASCYRQMQEGGFMNRLIVWGEFRSDNCILGNGDGGDLTNIANLNIIPTNGYAAWGDFYSVINLCNTVIYFAPQAYANDPNFTEGQLNGYLAEVKGLRAYCYFTLVKTFRDIPFTTQPTIDDTVEFRLPQSDPDEIVNFLIEDLKDIEPKAVTRWNQISYTKGRVTQNAIRCLIADMCLWMGRYDEAIEYCDRVLQDPKSELEFVQSMNYNYNVFINGNSTESIFELQFNRNIIGNNAIMDFYADGAHGGSQRIVAYDFTTTDLWDATDQRQYDAYWTARDGVFPVKKFVSYRNNNSVENVREGDYQHIGESARDDNWIIYRLSDVYLMKAEAMVEGGKSLQDAWQLVKVIYDRANPENADGLATSFAESKASMRQLILDERQREFMFEGKRYFDLLRLIKHDPSQFDYVTSNYLKPKYITLDAATVSAKLKSVDALYMPIKDTELKANHQLVQNPFYEENKEVDINK